MSYKEFKKEMNTESKRPVVEKYKAIARRIANAGGKVAEEGLNKGGKVVNKALSLGSKRMTNKRVLKPQNRVTIVENQPVYSKDKSRYFKTAWEEERRQLFFK